MFHAGWCFFTGGGCVGFKFNHEFGVFEWYPTENYGENFVKENWTLTLTNGENIWFDTNKPYDSAAETPTKRLKLSSGYDRLCHSVRRFQQKPEVKIIINY